MHKIVKNGTFEPCDYPIPAPRHYEVWNNESYNNDNMKYIELYKVMLQILKFKTENKTQGLVDELTKTKKVALRRAPKRDFFKKQVAFSAIEVKQMKTKGKRAGDGISSGQSTITKCDTIFGDYEDLPAFEPEKAEFKAEFNENFMAKCFK